jgi:hypothetical protein
MSFEELERCLEALVGEPSVHHVLDEEVDALHFAHNVLGLAEVHSPSADQSLALASDPTKSEGWAGGTMMALSSGPGNA